MSTPPLNLAALEMFGAELGRKLPTGSVVWLEGPLGAGKTTLARAIGVGRGLETQATSPTYSLVHHYEGPRGAVYHLDCYRLMDPEEAAGLDWETFAQADLLLIEWPERAGAWAPQPTHRIRVEPTDDDRRTVAVE
ncbi:MAG: tRNA (adenosine(37)-N6)-threonylcarbamoyltransferase complex ATPase subunit type 1 TsaE [Gemmatimonadota bacterium]